MSVAALACAAPAAFASEQRGVHRHNTEGPAPRDAFTLAAPQLPVGALVFAGVGSLFLFRRGRPLPVVEYD